MTQTQILHVYPPPCLSYYIITCKQCEVSIMPVRNDQCILKIQSKVRQSGVEIEFVDISIWPDSSQLSANPQEHPYRAKLRPNALHLPASQSTDTNRPCNGNSVPL